MTSKLYFLLSVASVLSTPVDDPIRIDLPVYDQPRSESNVPLDPKNIPDTDKSTSGNFIPSRQDETKLLSNKISPEYPAIGSDSSGVGLFANPVTKIEGAFLETEGFGSKTLSIKENVQNVVAGLFQPKPIVDTIKEEEKYGNNGDKFHNAGRAIVGGAEGISNFFNSILEVPSSIIKSITRAATEKLNNVGAKLIGL